VEIPFIGCQHRGRDALDTLRQVLGIAGKMRYLRRVSSSTSPNQMHNAFQVVGLRKQIHQVHLLDAITSGEQSY